MANRGSKARLFKSRLTSKGQATIPAPVRKSLNLSPGDNLVFQESRPGAFSIRKAEPLDFEFLSALEDTLSEWNSKNDDEAYSDL